MKTTINVQLGPYNFPFELEAYEFLKHYLDKVNDVFAHEESKDEILEDIETRIGELLQQNRLIKAFPVDAEEIKCITVIMGDFAEINGDANKSGKTRQSLQDEELEGHPRRRIYRDQDDAAIGGVCSGLSYYLGWDPVVLRIIMVVLLLVSFGTFFMAYLIAWAVIPAAKTTSEKLMMRGNAVNLDNIQQHVKAEANRANRNVKRWGRKLEDSIQGNAKTSTIWRFFRLLVGFVLLSFGIALLFFITIFMAWSEGGEFIFFGGNIHDFTSWVAPDGIGEYMLTGIGLIVLAPAVSLLYTGMHYLLGLKLQRKWIYLFSTLCFITGLLICTYTGIRLGKEFDTEGVVSKTIESPINSGDTLYLNITNDPYFIGRSNDEEDVLDMVSMESGSRVISADVEVKLMDTDRDNYWIEVVQSARGRNLSQAGTRASQLDYQFNWTNNTLTLNPYFKIPEGIPYRAQSIEVMVHVPDGRKVMLNERWGWVSWRDEWKSEMVVNEGGYLHLTK